LLRQDGDPAIVVERAHIARVQTDASKQVAIVRYMRAGVGQQPAQLFQLQLGNPLGRQAGRATHFIQPLQRG
jgi:hypothetical protein